MTLSTIETVMLSRQAQKQPTPRHSLTRNRAVPRRTVASSGSGTKSRAPGLRPTTTSTSWETMRTARLSTLETGVPAVPPPICA